MGGQVGGAGAALLLMQMRMRQGCAWHWGPRSWRQLCARVSVGAVGAKVCLWKWSRQQHCAGECGGAGGGGVLVQVALAVAMCW